MKEKLPLIIGLGLPALFVLGVALFVLFPSSSSLPKISFVYATYPAGAYELQDSLIVVNNKLSVSGKYGNSVFRECDPYITGTSYDQNGRSIAVDLSKRPIFCDTTLPDATNKRLEKALSLGLKIFEHDPVRNESRELTIDDALRLTLDDVRESRDGFEFTYGRNSSDFYGFNNNYSQDFYLKNSSYATKMKLVVPASSQYGSGVMFIGWVR